MSQQRPIRRTQILREAEGYLELLSVFADRWPPKPAVRDRVARRALATLDRIDRPGRDLGVVLYLRGLALKLMERYEEAIVPFSAAAELDDEDIHVHLSLGWCYKRIGQLDRAIEALEAGLAVDPGEAILYFNLACYWTLAGNKRHALDYLGRALAIDSDYRDMIDDEPDFDSLREDPDFQELISSVIV